MGMDGCGWQDATCMLASETQSGIPRAQTAAECKDLGCGAFGKWDCKGCVKSGDCGMDLNGNCLDRGDSNAFMFSAAECFVESSVAVGAGTSSTSAPEALLTVFAALGFAVTVY